MRSVFENDKQMGVVCVGGREKFDGVEKRPSYDEKGYTTVEGN